MNAVVQPNTEPMLLRQDADGVATITLNRPGQFNALSQPMLEALLAELEAVAADKIAAPIGAGRPVVCAHRQVDLLARLLQLVIGEQMLRGLRRNCGERFAVADVDEALNELERIVEPARRIATTVKLERDQSRYMLAAQITARVCVVGMRGQRHMADMRNLRVLHEKVEQLARVAADAVEPQRQRLDPQPTQPDPFLRAPT